ncbi:septal ring lytic transglycosylase RlpA family protein [Ramlibacter sp. PS4R-6]|uniref:septal ring lytic transglycosylase RlpA family protein n=1 Tax=Ramlibacter sp. PS4R-6 TaxID=3133438 RepID=UPI00309F3BF6
MLRRCSCVVILLCACIGSASAAPAIETPHPPPHKKSHAKPQVGQASIYARKFAGRRMANGERMDPRSDNAASKTLPLGTRARVTNLDTGRSALVTIEDRGPFVRGRIVDLSPASAAQIGLTPRDGVARVEVVPVELPGAEKAQTVAGE